MDKGILVDLYCVKRLSSKQIGSALGVSASGIDYWLKKHSIQKRGIADAAYARRNPYGDPFSVPAEEWEPRSFLYGLGLGLFWGEGNKRDAHSVRLGNSNPEIIKAFIVFLKTIYKINGSKLRFGLQIFNDSDKDECLRFWQKELDVPARSFQKPVVSRVRGVGTYKKKSEHGVLTIYFNNKKLRDEICDSIEKLRFA